VFPLRWRIPMGFPTGRPFTGGAAGQELSPDAPKYRAVVAPAGSGLDAQARPDKGTTASTRRHPARGRHRRDRRQLAPPAAASSLVMRATQTAGRDRITPPAGASIMASLAHLKQEILAERRELDLKNAGGPEHQRHRKPCGRAGVGKSRTQGLRGPPDAHPTPGDEAGLRRLGVNVTSDPISPRRTCSFPEEGSPASRRGVAG